MSELFPGYRKVHLWVEYHFGKPRLCSHCGDNNYSRYEWANISGNYLRERKDWVRLCVLCHRAMDEKKVCINGHRLTPENLYIYPGRKKRGCKICRELGRIKYRQKISSME